MSIFLSADVPHSFGLRATFLANALAVALIFSAPADAQVTREKLKQLVDAKVDTSVIVALIEKDCVAFNIDSDVLLELRGYPAAILNAALKCQRNPNAQNATESTTAHLLIRIFRNGDGSSAGPWGIFLPFAGRASNGIDDSTLGDPNTDASLGVLFTAEENDPITTLGRIEQGDRVSARWVSSCVKDTTTTRIRVGLLPAWIRWYGCYWAPRQESISLDVPAGRRTIRAVTLSRWRITTPTTGDTNWFEVEKSFSEQARKTYCAQSKYEATATVTLQPGEHRDLSFTVSTMNVKVGNDPGLCTEMSLQ